MSAELAVLMALNLKQISIYIHLSRTYKDRFELRGETNVADPDPGSEIRCIRDPWIPEPDPGYPGSQIRNTG